MHRKRYLMFFLLFVVVFECCDKSENTKTDEPTSFVSFYDKGAVIPDPISSLVTIQEESIQYQSFQNDAILQSWSANIQSSEYDHINSIIDNNKLIGAENPTGEQMCDGLQEMIIIIKEENIIDTLTIAGVYRCDKDVWPQGLDSLVICKNVLIDKYKPK